ncbi:hypothetical protein [Micromonospora sp. NBC_01813]|uniref:hypothetical protein n=1 Tax=Micromonospora sp. NBC_01813 TaxID=2975988 RepID=UPI002DDB3B25|nr:hypothetical protein [Micromonospora sp. NBC_01813]WSA12920.1 hypothetical protein OG958_29770 [Micromonospora sp. NBC_01813]
MDTPTRKRFVELSHVIRDGMVTYPGLPAPAITEWLSREAVVAGAVAGRRVAGLDTSPVRAYAIVD